MLAIRILCPKLAKNELGAVKRLLSTLHTTQQQLHLNINNKTPLNVLSRTKRLQKVSLFHTSCVKGYKTPRYDWVPVKTTKNYLQEMERDESESSTAHVTRYILWICLFLIPLVSLRLGIWQYERLNWKVDLIANCEERLYMPPLEQDNLIESFTLNKNLTELQFLANDEEEFENYIFEFNDIIDKNYQYRRVNLIGEWDYSNEMFVGPRIKNGHKGYKLFTPLILRGGKYDGEKLLVERGWVSERNAVPYLRTLQHLSCPQGIVKISVFMKAAKRLGHGQMKRNDSNGRIWQLIEWPDMLKQGDCKIPLYCQQITDLYDHNWKVEEVSETSLNFDKNNGNNKKSWFSWFSKNKTAADSSVVPKNGDPSSYTSPTLNKKLHLVDKADKSLEFDEQQFIKAGVPIGEPPEVKYTNDHFQYMVTWFLLAITSGTALCAFLFKQKRNGLRKVSDMKKARLRRAEKIFGK